MRRLLPRRVSIRALGCAVLLCPALLALGWWLLVTGGRPWKYRPFGKYAPMSGWFSLSPPVNPQAREEYIAALGSDDPEVRSAAVLALAHPIDEPFDPQWAVLAGTLRTDPPLRSGKWRSQGWRTPYAPGGIGWTPPHRYVFWTL